MTSQQNYRPKEEPVQPQRLEPEWNSQKWDKWSGPSRSSNWAPQSWSSATPQRPNDKTSGQKVDWHAESTMMLKQYITPATPKTQSYQAMDTPETAVKRRAAAVNILSELREKYDDEEAPTRKVVFGDEPTTNHPPH